MKNHFLVKISIALGLVLNCYTSAIAAEFPKRDTLELKATGCGDLVNKANLYTYNDPTNKSLGLGIFLSPLITAGVDFVGNQLSERAMRKERTVSASTNVLPAPRTTVKAQCLQFIHKNSDDANSDDIIVNISLEGVKSYKAKNPLVMKATIQSITYNKTVSGKNNKTRGIMVQLATNRVGTSNAASQTLLIGNLKTGQTYEGGLEFPLMTNPYYTVEKDKEISLAPFVFSVTVTEIRDANRALSFASSVANAGNDDITAALIGAVN